MKCSKSRSRSTATLQKIKFTDKRADFKEREIQRAAVLFEMSVKFKQVETKTPRLQNLT